jgi:hypothetical protein
MEQAISAFEGPFSNPVSHREGRAPVWVLGPRNKAPTCRTRTSTLLFLYPRPKDTPPSTHLLSFPPTWYNSCIFTCIWLLHFFHLHHPSLLPYAFLASSPTKPQWFLRQSLPSAQMTLFASPRSLLSAFVRFSLLRLFFQSAS